MKLDPTTLASEWWLYIVGSAGGFFIWLGRLIFTNNKRIDALESDYRHAVVLREKQEKMVEEIREDQKKLINHLLTSKKAGE